MSRTAEQKRFGRVAVLMGGWSAEREVSLKSGHAVHQALLQAGVDAIAVDAGRDVLTVLAKAAVDRVFIALHGRGGEDGTIQAGLELLGLPYTGAGVLGSALAMDKLRTKWVWQGAGLPTPAFDVVVDGQAVDVDALVSRVGLPLIVKPAREGSSIGMSKVDTAAGLRTACAEAGRFDRELVIERWITGEEYTVSLLGDRVLPAIRLETPRQFYDYAAKYQSDDTRYHCPCGLGDAELAEMERLARRAYSVIGGRGWGRIDIMRDHDGRFWLLEANTIPGMTDHSLVPMAAAAAGLSFGQLVCAILATTLEETGS